MHSSQSMVTTADPASLDLFRRISSLPADAVVGWRDGVPVSNESWLARMRAWAALAHRCAGSRIALFHDDSLEFAAALVGAWSRGKTVWLPGDTLPASCTALGCHVDGFFGQFPPSLGPLSPAADDLWSGTVATPGPDHTAVVVFTSGSTGVPTPIPKLLSQMTSEVEALERQFGAALGDAAVLATISHQHIYGLLFRILWPLTTGRPVHAGRFAFPETLAPALAARPCVLLSSPAHLKRLPSHLDWSGAARAVRAVFSSGGMLEPEASLHAARLLGHTPIEVYGSSESGGVAWRRQDLGEAWTALPQVQWRLSADGTLAVRSPFAGPHGWLHLADRAEMRGEDRFMLLGRADRIVKIEEKRVSLDALETALKASPMVCDARLVMSSDGARQSLAAFVIPSDLGRTLLEKEGKPALNARLRLALADCAESVVLPRRWRYLDAWPVNAQGKTTAAELLALL